MVPFCVPVLAVIALITAVLTSFGINNDINNRMRYSFVVDAFSMSIAIAEPPSTDPLDIITGTSPRRAILDISIIFKSETSTGSSTFADGAVHRATISIPSGKLAFAQSKRVRSTSWPDTSGTFSGLSRALKFQVMSPIDSYSTTEAEAFAALKVLNINVSTISARHARWVSAVTASLTFVRLRVTSMNVGWKAAFATAKASCVSSAPGSFLVDFLKPYELTAVKATLDTAQQYWTGSLAWDLRPQESLYCYRDSPDYLASECKVGGYYAEFTVYATGGFACARPPGFPCLDFTGDFDSLAPDPNNEFVGRLWMQAGTWNVQDRIITDASFLAVPICAELEKYKFVADLATVFSVNSSATATPSDPTTLSFSRTKSGRLHRVRSVSASVSVVMTRATMSGTPDETRTRVSSSFSVSSSSSQHGTESRNASPTFASTSSQSSSLTMGSQIKSLSNSPSSDKSRSIVTSSLSFESSPTQSPSSSKNSSSKTRSLAETKSPDEETKTKTVAHVARVLENVVAAPAAQAAVASVAAAASGAAAPAMRALSLAAIATACKESMIFVPSPPLDVPLPWPQGSLVPQIQISLPNDDPKDAWRKHFRGAILANFVVFPLIVLSVVSLLVYGVNFLESSDRIRKVLGANYLFSIKEGSKLETRAPDFVADSRMFGVMLFLFGLGVEGGTCAFVTLLGAPRGSSSSLGIDIFLSLLAIAVVAAAFFLLLKVIVGVNDRLECVPVSLQRKEDGSKPFSERQLWWLRVLYGNLGWTYCAKLAANQVKIEEAKQYFLQRRNLFGSNQGPCEFYSSSDQNKNKEKSNDQDDPNSNSFLRKLSVYSSFVDCFLTFFCGLIRGLVVAGYITCTGAVASLLSIQLLILLWAVGVRSSLYPITKAVNIVMAFLLLGASISMKMEYDKAGSFAVTVAMLISFLGMVIVFARLSIRRYLRFSIFPKRDLGFLEKRRASMNPTEMESINQCASSMRIDEYEITDVDNGAILTLPLLVYSEDNFAFHSQNHDIDLGDFMSGNSNDHNSNHNVNIPPSRGESPTNIDQLVMEFASSNNKNNNQDDDDDLYSLLTRQNGEGENITVNSNNNSNAPSTSAAASVNIGAAGEHDAYQSESKEEKLKRLLAELDDDVDVNEALEMKMAEERRRKQTMTEEMKNEALRKIQEIFLGNK